MCKRARGSITAAVDRADRPRNVTEEQLDSVTDFLHRAAVHPNEAVGKVAGQCLLLMVSRRGRVRDMFRNVTTFTSVPAASKTSWCVSYNTKRVLEY